MYPLTNRLRIPNLLAIVAGLVSASYPGSLAAESDQDVLRLRDGNVLRGRLVTCDGETIKFRTGAGTVTLSRSGVLSIAFGVSGVSSPRPPEASSKQLKPGSQN